MHPIDSDIGRRISILRYVMIFGIIVLHTPPYVPLAEMGSTMFDYVKAFFQHAVFRVTVPVLTFISGYLLFRSELYLNFGLLVKKKTKSILLPYLLFNIPLVPVLYLMQVNQIGDHTFSKQLYPIDPVIWANAMFGLKSTPINYPLDFLRDLYFISIAAPIFGFLLRRAPAVGALVVFSVFWFNLDGRLIFRDTMPIVFYLGGLVATQKWDMCALDRFALPFFLTFIGICLAVVFLKVENRDFLRVVSPLLIWPATAWLEPSRLGSWLVSLSPNSFFLFLCHGPVLIVLWIAYQKLFSVVPYWIFWVLAPIFTAAILQILHNFARQRFPGTVRVALGGR